MKKEKLDATTSGEKEVAATKEKNNDIQARNYCNGAPENRRDSLRNSLTPIPPATPRTSCASSSSVTARW